MRRIYVYFISQLIFAFIFSANAQDTLEHSQDTLPFPLKIRFGADVYGPVSYYFNKNILSIEGFLSVDIDPKKAIVAEAGYLDFKHSQYNYTYLSKGSFIRLGVDFNLIRHELSVGKYYAGIGLRYGFSMFNTEVPILTQTNYWGTATGSIPTTKSLAHFVEASPGIRTEIFRNFSMGWVVRLRIMVYSSASKDNKALSIPGFGNAFKTFSPGINYYLIWSIPYKKLK
jgi:hypothetical protein